MKIALNILLTIKMPNHHKNARRRRASQRVINIEKCCICFESFNISDSLTFPCCHRCIHYKCLSSEIQNCPICRMVKDRYRVLPCSVEQKITRQEIYRLNSEIKIPHCRVCGDTEDLVITKTKENETVIFCSYCFKCQETLVAGETFKQNMIRLLNSGS